MIKRSHRHPVWVVSSNAVAKVFSDSAYGGDSSGHLLRVAHHIGPGRSPVASVRVFKGVFQILFVFVVCTLMYYYSVLNYDVQIQEQRRIMRKSMAKVANARVYLYSAIGVRYEPEEEDPAPSSVYNSDTYYNHVVMVGWEHSDLMDSEYTCCFWLQNNSIAYASSNVDRFRYDNSGGHADLNAVRYACPLDFDHTKVISVSLAFGKYSCEIEAVTYIEPTFPTPRNRTELALCTSVAYGLLNPQMLLEWFEVQRTLGVTKILAYLYMANLNNESIRIFQHYESIEFADIVTHNIPETDEIPRSVGEISNQCLNDDRVALLDCQERLYGYQYVGILDKNEIVLPTDYIGYRGLETFVAQKWKETPDLAGIRFLTQIHLLPDDEVLTSLDNVTESRNTSSNQTTSTNQTAFFERFPQCSSPMKDSATYIYMPTRVVQGAIHTHSYKSLSKFEKEIIRPSDAVMHQYSRRRSDWIPEKLAMLQPENLSDCPSMRSLLEVIMANVTEVRETLGMNEMNDA